MPDPQSTVLDLIAGRWRSQAIYAGVKLGVFDLLGREPKTVNYIADTLGLNGRMTYRLLRALGAIGLLVENEERIFTLNEAGGLLRHDHPQSLQSVVLLREGPEHSAIWKHLPEIVRDGMQNGFVREYGTTAFEYAAREPGYAKPFDAAMSSYSRVQTDWVLEALSEYDFNSITSLCDVGGGLGHLLCHFLKKYPHLHGSVLERPGVLDGGQPLWADTLKVSERCAYVTGDMFADVPVTEAYFLKMVLHNWSDAECMKLLRNIQRRAPADGRLFIIEHVIPDHQTPHFAKLFDLHMMVWGTGGERTQQEYEALLSSSGWKYSKTWKPKSGDISILECTRI